MTSPAEVIEELLRSAPEQAGEAFRSFRSPPGMTTRAYVDGMSRLPGVSLRVHQEEVPRGLSFPKIKGAEILIAGALGEPSSVTYRIQPASSTHLPVFIELAGGLIEEVERASSAKQALLAVSRRLAAWARFFDARGENALGRGTQLGLIGELLCLDLLGWGAGLGNAVQAWRGPEGATHDFQTAAGSIEVKITTSSAPERFRISSERQLDESHVPHLILCAITAQELPSGDASVCTLVDRLRARVDAEAPAERTLFDERLVSVGYCDQDRPQYGVRIAVLHMDFMAITDDFPRIRPVDIRPGVSGVSYDVSRAAILPYMIPTTSVDEIIRATN